MNFIGLAWHVQGPPNKPALLDECRLKKQLQERRWKISKYHPFEEFCCKREQKNETVAGSREGVSVRFGILQHDYNVVEMTQQREKMMM